ncbi:MAG TPA: hypothetical protein VHU14_08290 [Solirubrobacterales bacterium]|nr:hypothetical protein [Solirubrobacterales bacterium]
MPADSDAQEDAPDAWGELNSRYRHDDRAQFLLFVEQLVEARELILSGRVTKLRIALVTLDNLAEMLLHRQMKRAQAIGEEGWVYGVPRLGGSDLRRFETGFGARVSFARREASDALAETGFSPLLDDGGEAIFRTAHAYRNRVYHADHHNPTVLPLITKAYFAAIGVAFERFQPRGAMGSMDAVAKRLEAFGYEGSEDPRWGRMFAPAEAARTLTENLSAGIEVELDEAREELAADLGRRADWAEEMIAQLAREGLSRERLEASLSWWEFWEEMAGHDAEVVDLANEVAELWNVVDPAGEAERSRQMSEKGKRRSDRVRELYAEFRPKLDLGQIDQQRRLGRRLTTATSVGALFTRYHRLDDTIESFERFLDDTAIGWDRHMQEEVDSLREERLMEEE